MRIDKPVTVITGRNAQGKTSILEAIWLCTGCKSFRYTRERDYISLDEPDMNDHKVFESPEEEEAEKQRRRAKAYAEIVLNFDDKDRHHMIEIAFHKDGRKEIRHNMVLQQGVADIFGIFKVVCFTPEDMDIASGGPDARRRFLDIGKSQIDRQYLIELTRYNKILEQRNNALKLIRDGKGNRSMLDVYNDMMAASVGKLTVKRINYCNELGRLATEFYYRLSGEREVLSVQYLSTYSHINDDTECESNYLAHSEVFLKMIKEYEERDIRAGSTQIGIHRDEFNIRIDGKLLRGFGSQGQKKSAAVCFKLAEAEIMRQHCGEPPVMLLDDVMSELDEGRQEFLLNAINDMQTIITCCSLPDGLAKHDDMNIVMVENGRTYGQGAVIHAPVANNKGKVWEKAGFEPFGSDGRLHIYFTKTMGMWDDRIAFCRELKKTYEDAVNPDNKYKRAEIKKKSDSDTRREETQSLNGKTYRMKK